MGCTNVVLINNIIEVPIEKNVRYEDGLIHLLFLGSITEPKGIYDLVVFYANIDWSLKGELYFMLVVIER